MNTRKGLISLFIPLIVFAVFIVGGGMMIYLNNKAVSPKVTENENLIRKEEEQPLTEDIVNVQPSSSTVKTVTEKKSPETKNYLNDQLKFTFKYPADFQLEECPVSSILLYRSIPTHATPCTSKDIAFLKIRIPNYSEKQLAQKYVDSFVKDHEWWFQQTATSTYVTSTVLVMGHTAIKMDGVVSARYADERSELIGQRITSVAFIHEGRMYELSFYDLPVSDYENTMNSVLSTLKAVTTEVSPVKKELPPSDEALKIERDMQRVANLSTLKLAISLYLSDVAKPSLCETGKIYRSTDGSNAINGTGWLPIDFTKVSSGSPISGLFADPLNDSRYYYAYTCDPGNYTFELNAWVESFQYGYGGEKDVVSTDKGNNPNVYEVGTNLNLIK